MAALGWVLAFFGLLFEETCLRSGVECTRC
nr:MAG TPA: hypothetical protein [Caudoviricetes sp.]